MPLDVSDLKCDEELYRLLVDNSLQGLLILQDERIILVNKAVSEVIGYTPEELQYFSLKDLMAIVHPEDQERTFRCIENLIAGNLPPVRQEFRIIRKDRAISWVDTLASCIEYQDRPALHLAYLDITEQKRTEAVLKESEERYQAFIANSSEGIYRLESVQSMPITLSEDDQIKFILEHAYIAECNDVFARLYGMDKAEELNGIRMADFLISDPRNIEAIRAFVRSGYRLVDVESYEIDKKQNIHIISSSLTGIVEDGFLVRAWGVQKDISARKRVEEALKESEEKYHTAIDFTYDCETWLSPQGNYVYVSPSCQRLTGYSTDEFLEDPELLEKIIHLDDRKIYPRHFQNKDDIVGPIDFRIITRNGEERWISHACQSVYGSDGHYLGRRASNRDITDQKRIEEALRETRDYLENLIDYANAPIIVWDTSFNITRFNRAFEMLTGLEEQDVLGKPLEILFPDCTKEDSLALIMRTSSGERWDAVEIPILRTDGSVRTILWNSANIYNKDRTAVVTTIAQGQDITDRKRAEKALEDAVTKSERDRSQLEAIFAAQNDAVIIYDTEMIVQRANKSFIEIYGFDPVGLNLRDIIQRVSCRWLDGRPFLLDEQPTPRALRGEKVVGECFMVTRADGVEVAVETSSGPIQVEDRIIGSVTVWRDITERMRAEEVLRLNEEKAVILSDVTGRLLANVNPQTIVEELCHRVMDFLDCHVFFNYLVDEERGCLHLNACAGISAAKAREIEWLDYGAAVCGCAARDRERIVIENIPKTSDPRTDLVKSLGIKAYACHPLMSQEQVIGTISFGTRSRNVFSGGDLAMMKTVAEHVAIAMTRVRDEEALRKSKNELEQKVQERTAELQKALEASEESARAKAAFLANMSHELRTPMNAVIGFSSLLLDETLTSDQREYIEGIRNGGESLLAIIDDILDFSRAEKKKVELEHQPFSLKHLIDESLDMVATQAGKKGLNLSQTINYGTPDTIIGDHGRLRQILVNLLSNAVKFTDKGDVSVSISSKAVEGNRRQIFFEVKDTGIGIPQDKMNELFQPFTQVERTLSRKRDGVGLGLAITKNLVELMGGKIWAESIPGQGATFHFTIQAETIPGKQLDFGRMDSGIVSESLSGLKPMRILVAEDNPSNQRVLVEMMKRLGYRADAVADGREVVQALERQDYDLVLMDIKMPEMDGITATQVIRKLRPENGPKIVAITAFALEGDREKCIEAGMDDYIAKPVQMRELAEVLKKFQP